MKVNGLEPGIYFNLPASIYHTDMALSRTNIVALNDTPFTYWNQSWMNTDRKPQKPASDEMAFGEAFHCMMFEFPRFARDYFVFPIDKWDAGRIMIAKDDHDAIVAAIKVLRAGRDSKLFLSGGISEVTIVFDYMGHRFRTRHDYLTPVVTVDFKTTFSIAEWHLKRAFDKYGYDVQLALYKLARLRFKEQFRAGEAHIFGNVDKAFFNMFMASEINDFVFIFQRDGPPYPYEPLLPEEDTERSGMDKIESGLVVYERNFEKYGTKEWEVSDGKLKRFSMSYGMIRE